MKKPEAWTKANWLIDLKMNGPANPIQVIYVEKPKKVKSASQKRDDYFNHSSRFA